jgi:hypothetical protein
VHGETPCVRPAAGDERIGNRGDEKQHAGRRQIAQPRHAEHAEHRDDGAKHEGRRGELNLGGSLAVRTDITL